MPWARPISCPEGVTTELSDMFCALNGATRTPSRASSRHRPATTVLFPASEVVPHTINAPRGFIDGKRLKTAMFAGGPGTCRDVSERRAFRFLVQVSWLPDRTLALGLPAQTRP